MNLLCITLLTLSATASAETASARQTSAILSSKAIQRKPAGETQGAPAGAAAESSMSSTNAGSSSTDFMTQRGGRRAEAGDEAWRRMTPGTDARRASPPPPVVPVDAGNKDNGKKLRDTIRQLSQELGLDNWTGPGKKDTDGSLSKILDSPAIREASKAFAEAFTAPKASEGAAAAADANSTQNASPQKTLRQLTDDLLKDFNLGGPQKAGSADMKDLFNPDLFKQAMQSDTLSNLFKGVSDGAVPTAADAAGAPKSAPEHEFNLDNFLASLQNPSKPDSKAPKTDFDSIFANLFGKGKNNAGATSEDAQKMPNWFDDFDFEKDL